MTLMLADAAARERIRTDLATNLLVEAGAGSGKTTALVDRLLQHVQTGTSVEQLAAVTFTRKAADELREKFQLRLEKAVYESAVDSLTQQRCATALRELDRAFLGTIHAFCARILREHPLEAGLDPDFDEIPEADVEPMNREFWRLWLDNARRLNDPDLQALQACGIDSADLHAGFQQVMTYADVDFSTADVPVPDVTTCRATLVGLLSRALALLPAVSPPAGADGLMQVTQQLRFHEGVSDWTDPTVFCTLLETLIKSKLIATQNRWSDTKAGRDAAKQLSVDYLAWFTDTVTPVMQQWREHRYPVVIRVLQRAVHDFQAERHERGLLGFDDLLRLCADLLRQHPAVRDELGLRYRYLLVDEFQDTDPVQAEVCLLLASESTGGSDWQSVTPRAGALFVVGDPKQSIYRFRRADIQIYERVKQRFTAFGALVSLTTNFRSVPAIAALVNAHFSEKFPVTATAEQAAFSELVPAHAAKAGVASGVYRYIVQSESSADLVARDATLVASFIAERIAGGEEAGNFMILTERKAPISAYARALADRNIAVTTTGATLTQERELHEMMVVLRAVADPENQVLVAAALEGMFFGLTPADLYSARQYRLEFTIDAAPVVADHIVAHALAALHSWWLLAREHPTDVVLDRIFNDTGVLFLAASAPLGDARAGALLHLVETVRSAASIGRSGLTDAIGILDALLDAETDDAPLQPGRTDAVRIMNLHKAKGLEADIVILAAPTKRGEYPPEVHIVRGESGGATGGILITRGSGNARQRLAQPPAWDAMQLREVQFQRAEQDRLRYVATTRARRMLVVAQGEKPGKTTTVDSSIWRPLAATLDALAPVPLQIVVTTAPGRTLLLTSAAQLVESAATSRQRVDAARVPSVQRSTVTGDVTREENRAETALARGDTGGREWGVVVHRALGAMVRGRRDAGLRAFVSALVNAERLPPAVTDRLMALLEAVQASAVWTDISAAGALQSELSVMHAVHGGDSLQVMHGIIDAAVVTDSGWRIIDWKSDAASDAEWMRLRAEKYDRQVERYEALLTGVTGLSAAGVLQRVGQA